MKRNRTTDEKKDELKTCKILFADDSLEFVKAASNFIKHNENLKLEVIASAPNGEIAIKLADQLKPDLVLMDMDMPVMNGIEATRIIKSFENAPLVLIVSLHESILLKKKAMNAGADGFINKAEFGEKIFTEIEKTLNKNK
jgi:Response regulator containing a CheY-like receiver domain and an HTH DNA-binding domain